MSTTTAHGLEQMSMVQKPLKFIHLKGLVFGEFGIRYHVNDGFVIKDLMEVSSEEQLLFQKMESRIQQLNLMMVDSIFPLMLAEMATVVLLKGPMTCEQYVGSGMSVYGEFLMEHKLNQFIHHLLYADVADEKPFNGILDYERVYYRKGQSGGIDYFPVFEQQKLQTWLFNNAVFEIDLNKSSLTERKATLVLSVSMDANIAVTEDN